MEYSNACVSLTDTIHFCSLRCIPCLYSCTELNTEHWKWVTAEVVAVYPVSVHYRTNCVCCQ